MNESAYTTSSRTKLILVAIAVVLAFFAAYGFASARTQPSNAAVTGSGGFQDTVGSGCDMSSADAESSACGGCCAGSGSAEVVEGSAVAEGDVQRISVDVSDGFFNPGAIRLAAGIPTTITFGEGSGCMAEVMFKDFGVFESLTQGGAVIEIPALQPGEYEFSCGMEMVYGSLIVE